MPDLLRPPDLVRALLGDGGSLVAVPLDDDGLSLRTEVVDGALRIHLAGTAPVSRLLLRWHADLSWVRRYLPDAWERSYGDLAWLPEQPERVMPWSFLASDGATTFGCGVGISPGALCAWTADAAGVSLWADVRCGGSAVRLRGRTLHVADVVLVSNESSGSVDANPTGSPSGAGDGEFVVQQRLCRAMGARGRPVLPAHPVYGANDWHFALGNSGAGVVLQLAEFVSANAPDRTNRPYCVVDDGWSDGGLGHGPWIGNRRYGHMGELAHRLREAGTRPGLWYRPLTPLPEHRGRWRSSRNPGVVDPSIPEVLASVREQLARFRGWGYELLKHDFTVWDLLGRWGFQMGATITDDGWAFADTTRTTAEIYTELYATLHRGMTEGTPAGRSLVMGCNAFGHLVAGHAELQRIGDDASGRSWNRTRRMAVNALAFRGAQHGALYAVDADVAPITPELPWRRAVQWLHLLGASGTPAFISVDPASRTPEVAAAVRDAFTLAATPHPVAVPLDWTTTSTPGHWRVAGREQRYDWVGPDGAWPFSD